MKTFDEVFPIGLEFHGHRCPAMPMGIKAGLAAMERLGVEHSADKELSVISETGKGHAAGCFLDGIMTATGCTYGKSNIEKLYYNKMAFTLIDNKTGKSVRVSLKPDFFEKALGSPFVQQRKAGVPPQDIDPEIANPLIEKVIGLKDEMFLDIGEVKTIELKKKNGVFETKRCDFCGEVTFVNKLRLTPDGKTACIPCSGYVE
ncbi:MAG: formylmethanofuran dehydrogenase [Deltaproteobacteria bacterium]|nr:formylmethanofuran dehydrogenase [Deltaproteobacteria bacterium]